MKLLRFGEQCREKPGIIDSHGQIRDLSAELADISGAMLSADSLKKIAEISLNDLPVVNNNVRIGPCLTNIGKFLCIGLNYFDHAIETGIAAPNEPIIFSKANSAISGPYDEVLIPRHSKKTDWEAELGVIIGTPAKYVAVEKAMDYVAGYCIVNDISERAFQLEGTGQWIKGKSCDTFAPIGPWLVTKDEIPDPHNLKIWLEVDGKRYQDGHTSKMIFTVPQIVSYVSQFFTLHPGDIISTGTPAGVGLGQRPDPFYLRDGHIIRLGIDGLGEQKQKCVQER